MSIFFYKKCNRFQSTFIFLSHKFIYLFKIDLILHQNFKKDFFIDTKHTSLLTVADAHLSILWIEG